MKILKVMFPQNCIGCEMCVMEAQRQLKKIGLDGALVRVFRANQEETGKLTTLAGENKIMFQVELDPQVTALDIQKIKNICPTSVFSVGEEADGHSI